MKFGNVFFFILLISILILAGCSHSECKTDIDCGRSTECIKNYCNDGTCAKNVIDDCCGNGILEEGENICNCEEDFGSTCELNGSLDPTYFEATCTNGECLVDIKSDVIKTKDITKTLKPREFEALLKINYDEPFNAKESVFHLEFELTDLSSNIVEPKITKIQLKGTSGRTSLTLAEKDVNKILWQIGSKIDEDLFVTTDLPEPVMDMPVTMVISYEATKRIEGKSDETIRNDMSTVRVTSSREKLKFLNPSLEYYCDPKDTCDDNNPGTLDICAKDGTPFCYHKPIANKCGNYICEKGENKCICPNDCGPCSGDYGEFLEFGCSEEDECILSVKEEPKPIPLMKPKGISLAEVNVYSTYYEPFDYKQYPLTIKIKLMDFQEKLVPPITIDQIDITDTDGQLLTSFTPTSGNKLSKVFGEVSFEIPLQITLDYPEQEKTVKYQIAYTYSDEGDIKRNTLTDTIGKITFVDIE